VINSNQQAFDYDSAASPTKGRALAKLLLSFNPVRLVNPILLSSYSAARNPGFVATHMSAALSSPAGTYCGDPALLVRGNFTRVTADQLRQHFGRTGTVTVVRIPQHWMNRWDMKPWQFQNQSSIRGGRRLQVPKWYAAVAFSTEEERDRALDQMNETVLDGIHLTVFPWRIKPDKFASDLFRRGVEELLGNAYESNPSRFKEERDTQSILQVVEANYEELTTGDLIAAMHRLSKDNQFSETEREALFKDPIFEKLIGAVAEKMPDFSPSEVCNILRSLALLQNWPKGLIKSLLLRIAEDLDAIAFQSTTNYGHLICSLGKLWTFSADPTSIVKKIETQAQLPRNENWRTDSIADMLEGFAAFSYFPSELLPKLMQPLMLHVSRPDKRVSLLDMFRCIIAIGQLQTLGKLEENQPSDFLERSRGWRDVLFTMADRITSRNMLPRLSSKKIVSMIDVFDRFDMNQRQSFLLIRMQKKGSLDAWLEQVRANHLDTPMPEKYQDMLERALSRLEIDVTWIRGSEMLTAWSNLTSGQPSRRTSDEYTDEQLLAVFDSIDTDNSGDIDEEELKTAIKSLNPDASDEIIVNMLGLADKDGNLAVSFKEFKTIMQIFTQKGLEMLNRWSRLAATGKGEANVFTEGEMRAVFKRLDKDGSGSIDQEELKIAIKSIGGNLDDEAIKKMLRLADDNDNMEISFDEFKSIMLQRDSDLLREWSDMAEGRGDGVVVYTDEQLRAAFDAYDTDKSGTVDVDELTMALQALNPSADEEFVKKMFAVADSDGDMEISFLEFKRMMLQKNLLKEWTDIVQGRQLSHTKRDYTDEELRAVFDSIDTDKSGDI
jgi:Ca2+-binding EF-hand superfamily protein